ncbi:MAG: peptidylprolyl isomerase [Thiohalomonadaceae bacterium]
MSSVTTVAQGRQLIMHYSLQLADGTEVDSSYGAEPLQFTLGDGSLLTGLEACLLGMQAGQQASYIITPEQGFGLPDSEAVQVMACDEFPADMELAPGLIIAFTTPAGDELPGTIIALDENQATVDFNHPLAGHTVIFAVEILSVQA